ncbi:uncharacterized mitochondrial protein AtMg00310-like [Rosa rugosa]|uniref:uncharacterized mitochondrial protein AtMg00310-like n=1 Tax=Rosa rugosa TaxID=74645 RepID=UPI002B402A87|nr:uncharacterized mitochondrial protein AtMg00310-like [Rosa rugosa]
MTVFKFPTSLCNQINSALANFWWGNSSTMGIHWKKWASLGLPKSQGGLGFRNIADFNVALLAKQAWRLHSNPEALWVRVLKSRYFPAGSFWDAGRGCSPSWAWSSLLEGRSLLSAGSLWCIGSGATVNSWLDNWIPRYPTFNLRLLAPAILNDSSVEAITDRESNSWNLSTLHTILPPDALTAIQATSFGSHTDIDTLIWSAHSSGISSVKSGYNFSVSESASLLTTHPHHSQTTPPSV